MASTAMTGIAWPRPGLVFLGLDDLLAAVVARRRDVVAQVGLARGGLDSGRRLAEVVVRPVHPALRGRLLVLLNGHEDFSCFPAPVGASNDLFLLEAREGGEGRGLGLFSRFALDRALRPRLAGDHRQREQDRVLDQVPDVQRLIRDDVVFVLALLLDRRKPGLVFHEDQAVVDRDSMPERFQTVLAYEKNEALDYT